jgi:hypothetical protein
MAPIRSSRPAPPAGGRTFRCASCDFPITLLEADEAPACPRCGGKRATLAGKGPHVAWESDDEIEVVRVADGMTNIGRSFQAQVQLADPTVSRRHAVIHRNGEETILLDDHSLNGVFVGGERVDWRPLEDGDEIEIGSFRLQFIDAR